jgi:hypothetical protein
MDSPRQYIQPRKGIATYATPAHKGVRADRLHKLSSEGVSPPCQIAESTMIDKDTPPVLEIPNCSNIDSPGFGGSPNFSKSRSWMDSTMFSPEGDPVNRSSKHNRSSKLNSIKSKQKKESKPEDSQESEDERPSGQTKYVGDSINRSRSQSKHSLTNIKDPVSFNTPRQQEEKSSFGFPVLMVMTLAAVVGGVVIQSYNSQNPGFPPVNIRSADDWEKMRNQLRDEMKELRTRFPAQDKEVFKNIFTGLTTGMQKSPDRPGVLVLLSTLEGGRTVSCMMENILRTTASYFTESSSGIKEFMINGSLITTQKQFHNDLTSKLSQYGMVGVEGLEKMKGSAAIALHAAADDSNAPYKNGILVLSLEGSGIKEPCLPSRKAEELLTRYWSDLNEDKIPPLIARVTPDVVEIQPETLETIRSVCPNL